MAKFGSHCRRGQRRQDHQVRMGKRLKFDLNPGDICIKFLDSHTPIFCALLAYDVDNVQKRDHREGEEGEGLFKKVPQTSGHRGSRFH